jgi:hypothetical protein
LTAILIIHKTFLFLDLVLWAGLYRQPQPAGLADQVQEDFETRFEERCNQKVSVQVQVLS